MKVTVIGILADELGHATDYRGRHWATPAAQYARVQDPRILIDREHDHQRVGEVVHLEHDLYDRLWAVAEVDADAIDPFVPVVVGGETVRVPVDTFYSAERIIDDSDNTALLRWISLTSRPARVAPQPVEIRDGTVHVDSAARWPIGPLRDLDRSAARARIQRRETGGGPILVRHAGETATRAWSRSGDEPPAGRMMYGQPGRILSVR